MRAVFSLWTQTPRFKMTRETAMLSSASVAYAKRAFGDTELVSDFYGIQVADRLRWKFTSYSTALEKFCPKHARHVWMLGKIKAQSIQTVPHVHLDFDVPVFGLFGERVTSARVAVQSKDDLATYRTPIIAQYISKTNMPHRRAAFNMGITLWNDMELKDEFCNGATEMAYRYASQMPDGFASSLVCEQYYFAELMAQKRIEVTEVIPHPRNSIRADYRDFQFAHFWGNAKKNAERLGHLEERFRTEFPQDYLDFERGWPLIEGMKLAA